MGKIQPTLFSFGKGKKPEAAKEEPPSSKAPKVKPDNSTTKTPSDKKPKNPPPPPKDDQAKKKPVDKKKSTDPPPPPSASTKAKKEERTAMVPAAPATKKRGKGRPPSKKVVETKSEVKATSAPPPPPPPAAAAPKKPPVNPQANKLLSSLMSAQRELQKKEGPTGSGANGQDSRKSAASLNESSASGGPSSGDAPDLSALANWGTFPQVSSSAVLHPSQAPSSSLPVATPPSAGAKKKGGRKAKNTASKKQLLRLPSTFITTSELEKRLKELQPSLTPSSAPTQSEKKTKEEEESDGNRPSAVLLFAKTSQELAEIKEGEELEDDEVKEEVPPPFSEVVRLHQQLKTLSSSSATTPSGGGTAPQASALLRVVAPISTKSSSNESPPRDEVPARDSEALAASLANLNAAPPLLQQLWGNETVLPKQYAKGSQVISSNIIIDTAAGKDNDDDDGIAHLHYAEHQAGVARGIYEDEDDTEAAALFSFTEQAKKERLQGLESAFFNELCTAAWAVTFEHPSSLLDDQRARCVPILARECAAYTRLCYTKTVTMLLAQQQLQFATQLTPSHVATLAEVQCRPWTQLYPAPLFTAGGCDLTVQYHRMRRWIDTWVEKKEEGEDSDDDDSSEDEVPTPGKHGGSKEGQQLSQRAAQRKKFFPPLNDSLVEATARDLAVMKATKEAVDKERRGIITGGEDDDGTLGGLGGASSMDDFDRLVIDSGGAMVVIDGKVRSRRNYEKERREFERRILEEREKAKKVKGYIAGGQVGSDGETSNIALIQGPVGSGKTHLVYRAAEAAGCRVNEINTSLRRTAKVIENAFSEATKSKQLAISATQSAGKLLAEVNAATAALRWEVYERHLPSPGKKKQQGADGSSTGAVTKGAGKSAAKKDTKKPGTGGKKKLAQGPPPGQKSIMNFFKKKAVNNEASVGVEERQKEPSIELLDESEKKRARSESVLLLDEGDDAVLKEEEKPLSVSDDDEVVALVKEGMIPEGSSSGDVVEVVSAPPITVEDASPTRSTLAEVTRPSAAASSIFQRGPKFSLLPKLNINLAEAGGDSDGNSPLLIDTTTNGRPSLPEKAPKPNAVVLLVESGDVVFEDESGMYGAIKKMSNESKVPVIVTINKPMTDKEVKESFGPGVPMLRLEEPSLLHTLLQMLCILIARTALFNNVKVQQAEEEEGASKSGEEETTNDEPDGVPSADTAAATPPPPSSYLEIVQPEWKYEDVYTTKTLLKGLHSVGLSPGPWSLFGACATIKSYLASLPSLWEDARSAMLAMQFQCCPLGLSEPVLTLLSSKISTNPNTTDTSLVSDPTVGTVPSVRQKRGREHDGEDDDGAPENSIKDIEEKVFEEELAGADGEVRRLDEGLGNSSIHLARIGVKTAVRRAVLCDEWSRRRELVEEQPVHDDDIDFEVETLPPCQVKHIREVRRFLKKYQADPEGPSFRLRPRRGDEEMDLSEQYPINRVPPSRFRAGQTETLSFNGLLDVTRQESTLLTAQRRLALTRQEFPSKVRTGLKKSISCGFSGSSADTAVLAASSRSGGGGVPRFTEANLRRLISKSRDKVKGGGSSAAVVKGDNTPCSEEVVPLGAE